MNPDTADSAAGISAATALGRYGQPMEAAGAIAALTGPDTSNITSAVINVDGGLVASPVSRSERSRR
jgi:NAD(P)-dependent dehydrogenase (short-subunit alcohol dehydrogenase family)